MGAVVAPLITKAAIKSAVVRFALSTAASFIISKFTAPDVPESGGNAVQAPDQGVQQRLGTNTSNKLPVVYGEARVYGSLWHADITADNQTMAFLIPLCEGPIEEIGYLDGDGNRTGLWWDNYLLTLDSNGWVTKAVDRDMEEDNFLNGNLRIVLHKAGGRSTEMETFSTKWATNAESRAFPNIAYMYCELKYDRDKGVTGLSSKLGAEIKGKLVRTLTGPNSFALDSTQPDGFARTYSNNPSECLLDYLTDPVYGCGEIITNDNQIDLGSFWNHKEFCNEEVTHNDSNGNPVTDDVRYTCNGFVNTNETRDIAISDFVSNSQSTLSYTLGKFQMVSDKPSGSVYNFNKDNIYGDLAIINDGYASVLNKLEIQFNSKVGLFQDDQEFLEVPEARKSAFEPELVKNVRSKFNNNSVEVQRWGTTVLNKTRNNLTVSFQTDLRALALQVNDVIKLTNDTYGFADKEFRITTITETELDGGLPGFIIGAQEYAEADYEVGLLQDHDTAENTSLPNPRNFGDITNLTSNFNDPNGGAPFIDLTWTVPTGIVEQFEIYTGNRVDLPIGDRTFVNSVATSTGTFEPGTSYTFRVFGLGFSQEEDVVFWVRPINQFARGDFSTPYNFGLFNPTEQTLSFGNDGVIFDASNPFQPYGLQNTFGQIAFADTDTGEGVRASHEASNNTSTIDYTGTINTEDRTGNINGSGKITIDPAFVSDEGVREEQQIVLTGDTVSQIQEEVLHINLPHHTVDGSLETQTNVLDYGVSGYINTSPATNEAFIDNSLELGALVTDTLTNFGTQAQIGDNTAYVASDTTVYSFQNINGVWSNVSQTDTTETILDNEFSNVLIYNTSASTGTVFNPNFEVLNTIDNLDLTPGIIDFYNDNIVWYDGNVIHSFNTTKNYRFNIATVPGILSLKLQDDNTLKATTATDVLEYNLTDTGLNQYTITLTDDFEASAPNPNEQFVEGQEYSYSVTIDYGWASSGGGGNSYQISQQGEIQVSVNGNVAGTHETDYSSPGGVPQTPAAIAAFRFGERTFTGTYTATAADAGNLVLNSVTVNETVALTGPVFNGTDVNGSFGSTLLPGATSLAYTGENPANSFVPGFTYTVEVNWNRNNLTREVLIGTPPFMFGGGTWNSPQFPGSTEEKIYHLTGWNENSLPTVGVNGTFYSVLVASEAGNDSFTYNYTPTTAEDFFDPADYESTVATFDGGKASFSITPDINIQLQGSVVDPEASYVTGAVYRVEGVWSINQSSGNIYNGWTDTFGTSPAMLSTDQYPGDQDELGEAEWTPGVNTGVHAQAQATLGAHDNTFTFTATASQPFGPVDAMGNLILEATQIHIGTIYQEHQVGSSRTGSDVQIFATFTPDSITYVSGGPGETYTIDLGRDTQPFGGLLATTSELSATIISNRISEEENFTATSTGDVITINVDVPLVETQTITNNDGDTIISTYVNSETWNSTTLLDGLLINNNEDNIHIVNDDRFILQPGGAAEPQTFGTDSGVTHVTEDFIFRKTVQNGNQIFVSINDIHTGELVETINTPTFSDGTGGFFRVSQSGNWVASVGFNNYNYVWNRRNVSTNGSPVLNNYLDYGTYNTGDQIVVREAGHHYFIYRSLTDNNIHNNPITDTINWERDPDGFGEQQMEWNGRVVSFNLREPENNFTLTEAPNGDCAAFIQSQNGQEHTINRRHTRGTLTPTGTGFAQSELWTSHRAGHTAFSTRYTSWAWGADDGQNQWATGGIGSTTPSITQPHNSTNAGALTGPGGYASHVFGQNGQTNNENSNGWLWQGYNADGTTATGWYQLDFTRRVREWAQGAEFVGYRELDTSNWVVQSGIGDGNFSTLTPQNGIGAQLDALNLEVSYALNLSETTNNLIWFTDGDIVNNEVTVNQWTSLENNGVIRRWRVTETTTTELAPISPQGLAVNNNQVYQDDGTGYELVETLDVNNNIIGHKENYSLGDDLFLFNNTGSETETIWRAGTNTQWTIDLGLKGSIENVPFTAGIFAKEALTEIVNRVNTDFPTLRVQLPHTLTTINPVVTTDTLSGYGINIFLGANGNQDTSFQIHDTGTADGQNLDTLYEYETDGIDGAQSTHIEVRDPYGQQSISINPNGAGSHRDDVAQQIIDAVNSNNEMPENYQATYDQATSTITFRADNSFDTDVDTAWVIEIIHGGDGLGDLAAGTATTNVTGVNATNYSISATVPDYFSKVDLVDVEGVELTPGSDADALATEYAAALTAYFNGYGTATATGNVVDYVTTIQDNINLSLTFSVPEFVVSDQVEGVLTTGTNYADAYKTNLSVTRPDGTIVNKDYVFFDPPLLGSVETVEDVVADIDVDLLPAFTQTNDGSTITFTSVEPIHYTQPFFITVNNNSGNGDLVFNNSVVTNVGGAVPTFYGIRSDELSYVGQSISTNPLAYRWFPIQTTKADGTLNPQFKVEIALRPEFRFNSDDELDSYANIIDNAFNAELLTAISLYGNEVVQAAEPLDGAQLTYYNGSFYIALVVADAAARDALTTTGSGNTVYRSDNNTIEIFDGTNWIAQ